MAGLPFVLYTISALLFASTLYTLISLKKPGFYPPKNVLIQRAVALASGGMVFLLLGILFSIFL